MILSWMARWFLQRVFKKLGMWRHIVFRIVHSHISLPLSAIEMWKRAAQRICAVINMPVPSCKLQCKKLISRRQAFPQNPTLPDGMQIVEHLISLFLTSPDFTLSRQGNTNLKSCLASEKCEMLIKSSSQWEWHQRSSTAQLQPVSFCTLPGPYTSQGILSAKSVPMCPGCARFNGWSTWSRLSAAWDRRGPREKPRRSAASLPE